LEQRFTQVQRSYIITSNQQKTSKFKILQNQFCINADLKLKIKRKKCFLSLDMNLLTQQHI
jgi:hypothetical protein